MTRSSRPRRQSVPALDPRGNPRRHGRRRRFRTSCFPLGLPRRRLVLGLLLASRVAEGYASSPRTPPAHGPHGPRACARGCPLWARWCSASNEVFASLDHLLCSCRRVMAPGARPTNHRLPTGEGSTAHGRDQFILTCLVTIEEIDMNWAEIVSSMDRGLRVHSRSDNKTPLTLEEISDITYERMRKKRSLQEISEQISSQVACE